MILTGTRDNNLLIGVAEYTYTLVTWPVQDVSRQVGILRELGSNEQSEKSSMAEVIMVRKKILQSNKRLNMVPWKDVHEISCRIEWWHSGDL